MKALDRVSHLIQACGTAASILPATALFNEGWMLRLVLDWYAHNRPLNGLLAFEKDAVWYSEALLGSRFFATRRGDPRAEGWTHADAVVGHFRLRPGGRGDIEMTPSAKQLTVIEAKMASTLSAGTKNAPTFHQAARYLACMAHLLHGAGRPPDVMARVEFLILAPRARIVEGVFARQLAKSDVEHLVAERAAPSGEVHAEWLRDWFVPMLSLCRVVAVAWEELIGEITRLDPGFGEELRGFYARCLVYNPFGSRSCPDAGPVGDPRAST